MARKTIDVSFVRERANAFLMLSEDEKQGERDGVIGLLVSVLHASDNQRERFIDDLQARLYTNALGESQDFGQWIEEELMPDE